MAKLQKVNTVSSDMENRVVYEGKGVARWFPDYTDINKWYHSPSIPTGEKFFYYTDTDDDIYVQYGKNDTGWVSAKFFGQTVEIIEETLREEDNAIEATVRVNANFFNSKRNNFGSGGVRVKYTIKINNVVQYTFDGQTTSDFDNGSKPFQEFFVRIYPRETSTRTSMIMSINYPNGEFENRDLIVGFGLFNPNYPPEPPPEPEYYVPMAIRKNGDWKCLNNNNGKIKRRINNIWVDKSEEDEDTERQVNKGKNRIRKSGSWRQLPNPCPNDSLPPD